jgi:predicted enzyme related to lactoylglutathione lyase
MAVTHLFAGIPTADFASALEWYERFLGRPPDRFPKAEEAVWQVAETGLVYLVADRDRAGRTLITLIVDDLEARSQELAQRGIELHPATTLPGGVRTTTIEDPDGNRIQLGQLGGP